MNFGDRLRRFREEKDITQQQMAELIPMNQSNYSKIERNIQQPSLDQLIRIVEILNITLDELLGIDPSIYLKRKVKEIEKDIETIYNQVFKK